MHQMPKQFVINIEYLSTFNKIKSVVMNFKLNKNKLIAPTVILMLWLIQFLDMHDFNILRNFIDATVRTTAMASAYFISKNLYFKTDSPKKVKKKLFLYGMVFVVVIVSHDYFFSWPSIQEMMNATRIEFLIFGTLFSSVAMTISMGLGWTFYLSEKDKENKLAIAKLESLNNSTALDTLKNQINPHFLFNALSNIYSIAYLGNKETPDKILQLSKMLRYVIYDCSSDKVAITKEVEYLNDYIDFQKFKIKKDQNITFTYSIEEDGEISPMILLPFIENAFKHSDIGTTETAWVKIELVSKKDSLVFKVENTLSEKPQAREFFTDKGNGIGLENIRKRLELTYGSCYNLEIKSDEVFSVELKIEKCDD